MTNSLNMIFRGWTMIRMEQHYAIVRREQNPERRDFYEILWHTCASPTDAACLRAEDVDWNTRTICYTRKKLKSRGAGVKPALFQFGAEVEAILRRRIPADYFRDMASRRESPPRFA